MIIFPNLSKSKLSSIDSCRKFQSRQQKYTCMKEFYASGSSRGSVMFQAEGRRVAELEALKKVKPHMLENNILFRPRKVIDIYTFMRLYVEHLL